MKITEKDIDYNPSSLFIRKINNKVLSKAKCNEIIYEIEHSDIYNLNYANIEEYGYLVVGFRDFIISEQKIKRVIEIINKELSQQK